MKYICQECGKLVDEPYAKDGDGYFCSEICYKENYDIEEVPTVNYDNEAVETKPTEKMKYDWRGNPIEGKKKRLLFHR